MGFGVRGLVACLLCCVAGLVISPIAAVGEDLSPEASSRPLGSSPFESSLVIPGSPTEGEEIASQTEAQRSNPVAVAEREASRTKFQSLDAAQAAKVAGETFPRVIGEPLGGPPKLPAGQSITGYLNAGTARVDLDGGEHALVQSLAPMATEGSSGSWSPVNLGLREVGGAFEPLNPIVAVKIPKRLGEGAQLPALGVSVSPIDAQGGALGGSEGAVDGATAFFANTQADSDTIIKPSSFGVDVNTLLRSAGSPEKLFFRIEVPGGASLVAGASESGEARVVKDGVAIAVIPAPDAWDAAGTPVPVTMSVSGDTLTVTVAHRAGSYLYPVEVDPEFNSTTDSTLSAGTWTYSNPTGGFVQSGFEFAHPGGYVAGQRAEFYYRTNGDSKIYALNTTTAFPTYGAGGKIYSETDASIYTEFEGPGGYEGSASIAQWPNAIEPPPGWGTERLECVGGECSPANGGEHNLVRLVGLLEGSLNAEGFYVQLKAATVSISQPKETHSMVGWNWESREIDHTENAADSNVWMGPYNGAFEYTASDAGLGVAATKVEYKSPTGWVTLHSRNLLSESACKGIHCGASTSETYTYNSLPGLPDGADTVRVNADDVMPGTWSSEHGEGERTINVDSAPPHGLGLSGLTKQGEAFTLGETTAHVRVEASDSSETTTWTSGISTIKLLIDGRELGPPEGKCYTGACEYSVNGAELGSGTHTLTVDAIDGAHNQTSKSYGLNVYSATPVAVGPGSVNPESGDFALGATDVSLSGGSGSLAVTRHYDSRNVKEGEEGPMGPQWTLSLGSLAMLEVLPDGSVMVVGPEGLTHFAAKAGGGFLAPAGDSKLTLELKGSEYLLKDPAKGTTTRFTQPTGAKSWMPTISEGPVSTDTTTDEYTSIEVEAGKYMVEPVLELAPHSTASCSRGKMERGCRALEFVYGKETKASGEAQGEWGEYKNRLKEVLAVVYNPATKAMTKETAVAAYEYDHQGRLRAEWDPRVTPALKTVYGYDAEGHLTAITPAGQQPWLFAYGASGTDPSPGRLLSVTRTNASTPTGNGRPPENAAAPALSTTAPIEGTPVSVTTGTWINGALSYEYQWERCSPGEGKEVCTLLAGATNSTYTPTYADWGYEIRATVRATNGVGTVPATSNLSSRSLPAGVYERKIEFGKEGSAEGQLKSPVGVAADREGHVWVSDSGNNRIEEFSSAGTFIKVLGWGVSNGESKYETCTTKCKAGIAGSGNGQFKEPKGIAVDEEGYVLVADAANNRLEVFSPSGEYVEKRGLASEPAGIAVAVRTLGSTKYDLIYVVLPSASKIQQYLLPRYSHREFSESGSFGKTGSGNGQFKEPLSIALNAAGRTGIEPKTKGLAYVADAGNHRVQVLKFASETAGTLEYSSQFGKSGSEPGQFAAPSAVTVVPNNYYGLFNDLLVMDPGDSRFQQFSESGKYQAQATEKEAQGVAISTEGDYAYLANTGKSEITKWVPVPIPFAAPEPPNAGTSAVTTVDYGVPISGPGAPYTMSASEVARWGQKDVPTYATAIFPPDEPMGWPAKDYKRAGIYYLDNEARTVNVAAPSGGISTREFNEGNQVTRSLSADNRAAALKESCVSETECKSAELAKLIDTKSAYNAEGRLTDTWGPQHSVKLASGREGKPEQVIARNHLRYFYNEGAPGGETYDLVTKTIDGAETPSKEEFDKRTATTSYSGQSNLGWKLRAATSTTTDVGALNLTSTTLYNESGAVIETRGPASTGAGNPHDAKTVYYTPSAEAAVAVCREHPEWAGLPCQTEPGAQPETPGLPNLPLTDISYNLWNQPETITETFGTITRVKKTTYDAAGRPLSSEATSSIDRAMPKVTDHYSTNNGALETESTTVGETTQTLSSMYNSLGQIVEYSDADGNIAKYAYDIDGRIKEVSDGSNEGKSKQTYSYDATTGSLTELNDSSAGAFKASYDVAGIMTSESYPNGMTAAYAHDAAGYATALEYTKTSSCAKACPEVLFADSVVPAIHGEAAKQSSTFAEEPNYSYDGAGRLVQVQEVPAGEGCTTRIYVYEQESNRTSLTSRSPGAEGKCATEGGTVEKHMYDPASRLTDTGVAYETFGNTTKLPASDADGTELTSEYYLDNQVYKQTQGEETIEYKLDPEGRARETVSSGRAASTVISHYDGPGGALAWTSEGPGNWTRDIPGIGGALTAIASKTGSVKLQLHDLAGNVVATIGDSEAETKLASTYNSTEFGVPNGKEAPPKYAWLGAGGLAGELPSGVITQDGVTYIPQTGRALQTDDAIPPLPTNAATPFSMPVEAWVGSRSGEGAARELANAQQEEEAREIANRPPGALPMPQVPEEYGGGEEGEDEGGGRGCTGMSACAASRHGGLVGYHERGDGSLRCSVWASWGTQGLLSQITIYGHTECRGAVEVPQVEVQIALFMNGAMIGAPATETFTVSIGEVSSFHHTWNCPKEQATYRAWVWGHQYGAYGKGAWFGWGFEARTRTECREPLGNSGPPPIPLPPKD